MLKIFLKCSGRISYLTKDNAPNNTYSSFGGQGLSVFLGGSQGLIIWRWIRTKTEVRFSGKFIVPLFPIPTLQSPIAMRCRLIGEIKFSYLKCRNYTFFMQLNRNLFIDTLISAYCQLISSTHSSIRPFRLLYPLKLFLKI